MLNIKLTGDTDRVLNGVQLLSKDLNIIISDNGYPIHVVRESGQLKVENQNGRGMIVFDEPIHFFRGLGLWLQLYKKNNEFAITETPQFETSGVMIDVSRNAVLTVRSIKELLRKMAIMGLNMLMVYTEDTYEVKEYPYFGYMRGRYTKEEIQECDEYAHQLGIEMIPCIQTLAHLKEALKWGYANDMKDTDDILLVNEPKTYEFLRQLIKSATEPYMTERIHIGMDEALMLGLGKYLEKNGYQNRFEIMNAHLQQVLAITEEFGLKPMIWSDMYFRLASKNGNYYEFDETVLEKVSQSIPDVQMVYWDYYHDDENFYIKMLESHQKLSPNISFAGGLWTWNGIAPNYGRAMKNSVAALNACRRLGVKEVFATLWGDNGAETPIQSALAGFQLFAEYTYQETVDQTHLEERFKFCTGYEFNDFLLLNQFDETPGVMKDNLFASNPSKFLLWQDVLIGLYDYNVRGLPLNNHYENLIDKIEKVKNKDLYMSVMFNFYEKLARALAVKAELGNQLKTAYDDDNRKEVRTCLKRIQELTELIKDVRNAHREVWFTYFKPFGWEVLDIRYGGILSRIETAEYRINQWLNGEIDYIEELEEERLFFDGPEQFPEGVTLGREFYHRIATASPI